MNAIYGPKRDWRALTGVALFHVAALAGLLSIKPVAEAIGMPQPLMVSLLSDAPQETPKPEKKPEPLPPKPLPQVEIPLPPPPVLTTRAEAPSPVTAPPPPPEPVPVPVILPAPKPTPSLEPVRAVRAVAAPPAPPVIPPSFDADYLHNPAPVYPALSRRLGEQGRVLLRVLVSPEGQAEQVELRESSGFERLDKVARDTVQRWRFAPARQGERAVAGWVLVPISFSLRS